MKELKAKAKLEPVRKPLAMVCILIAVNFVRMKNSSRWKECSGNGTYLMISLREDTLFRSIQRDFPHLLTSKSQTFHPGTS